MEIPKFAMERKANPSEIHQEGIEGRTRILESILKDMDPGRAEEIRTQYESLH